MRLRVLLCSIVAAPASSSAIGDAEFEIFEFSSAANAAAQSRSTRKPIMLIQTLKGCGACMMLKQSVNRGHFVRSLFDQFVAVHVTATEMHSQAVNELLGNVSRAAYYPAAYFFSPGDHVELDVPALNADPRYARSFTSDGELSQAMRAALLRVGVHMSSEREEEATALERVEL